MTGGSPTRTAVARLGAFVALAAFATAYWLGLLVDPPVGLAAMALAAIAAGALLLVLIERGDLGRLRSAALAALVVLAATAVGLVAIGLPVSTLVPGGWDELGAGINRGFEGLSGDIEFPYAGEEVWSRRVLLGGLVCALALAAALAFWPRSARASDARGSRSPTRVAGLAALVAIYAGAAAMHPGPEPLLAGLALLLLVAAWLWLPGLGHRTAVLAGVAIAALGALALPVAAAIESGPLVHYRDWQLAAPPDPRSFTWDHAYGPLGQRNGAPLLRVRSAEPHYWRAAVLDHFNGYTWERSRATTDPFLELPTRVDRGSAAGPPERLNPDWLVNTEFEIRELRSLYAIAPGALRSAEDLDVEPTPSGTVFAEDDPLEEGDSYAALSYAPDPTADEMRAAPDDYAPALAHHTTIGLPRPEFTGIGEPPPEFPPPVVVPPGRSSPNAAERLAASRYGEIHELAERVTAGAATTYDAVKAVEVHLQSSYDYLEGVSPDPLPLRAFLFDGRAGYCEHFSGSMALMLRMLGIPARVATGFSPGTPDSESPDHYLVTDFDAHSWVEVYFTGIGWVPFDPTPSDAPAESQAGGTQAASASAGSNDRPRGDVGAATDKGGAEGQGSSFELPLWPLAIALALPLLAAAVLTGARIGRHRSLSPAERADARTRELAAALERLGWTMPPSITLAGVEGRLRAARRPAAADYAARLSEIRFGRDGGRLPSLSDRRRARRELRRIRGWGELLASYLAVPPWAPRVTGPER